MVNNHLVGGWATPLKNDGVKVTWDYEILNIWKSKKNVPYHQPVNISIRKIIDIHWYLEWLIFNWYELVTLVIICISVNINEYKLICDTSNGYIDLMTISNEFQGELYHSSLISINRYKYICIYRWTIVLDNELGRCVILFKQCGTMNIYAILSAYNMSIHYGYIV